MRLCEVQRDTDFLLAAKNRAFILLAARTHANILLAARIRLRFLFERCTWVSQIVTGPRGVIPGKLLIPRNRVPQEQGNVQIYFRGLPSPRFRLKKISCTPTFHSHLQARPPHQTEKRRLPHFIAVLGQNSCPTYYSPEERKAPLTLLRNRLRKRPESFSTFQTKKIKNHGREMDVGRGRERRL